MDNDKSIEGNKSTTRILIIRYGEISLKGMNRPWFERALEGRVRSALAKLATAAGKTGAAAMEGMTLTRDGGLMILAPADETARTLPLPEEQLIRQITKVFGVASVSPALRLRDRHVEAIAAAATDFLRDRLPSEAGTQAGIAAGDAAPVTFKIFGKRTDKSYPIPSPQLASRIGAAVLDALAPRVRVDINNPDVALYVHLRQHDVFLFDEKHGGFGGLPLGTNGRGMLLLSGGIDSPVAGWLMAKRGMGLEAVHFHSYPYTSERAQEKVEELATILAGYCGRFRLHAINLLPAQERIARECPEEFMTLLVRRFMMRIAERLATQHGAGMLITGENLGQVASQTAEALVVTDQAVSLPVMRPLIALDKTDIIDKAIEIGTYEKSIEPYEDCCTVFLPKHPATRPHLADIFEAEAALGSAADIAALEAELIKTGEAVWVK
ncbi:MAG: tRNA 4-thiouridine(8) synthase ThiI [Clostridiales Family XIII bacterium]|jgi:thiamine biosynthesis protein ThiI|nr:tRNA 4-thiouridine(8) synthase ThiI [Clostridiales Family XIII bacterium]